MLKKVSVLGAAGDLSTATMKPGFVLTTGAFSFLAPMLWAIQMLLGPSSSAAPPILNPAPQKSAAPETTSTERPGPMPPLPTPSSKDPGFPSPLKTPDPHLYQQMRDLLKQMQDVRALLGHLIMELRDLSGHLKLEITKGPAKY
uniref:Fc receptor like A n=1 Tax=Catagonus wagneri TaxID=51154 RepID=A0A8C3W2U3_9CETA